MGCLWAKCWVLWVVVAVVVVVVVVVVEEMSPVEETAQTILDKICHPEVAPTCHLEAVD